MRRIVTAAFLALLAAGIVATAAPAKEANVELSSTPAGIHPGDPWNPTITVWLEGDALAIGPAPTLTIIDLDTNAKTDFQATPTGEPGKYSVEVVFPEGGLWTYKLFDPNTERTYAFPAVYLTETPAPVEPAAPSAPKEVVAPVADSDSFPLWPVLGGSLAALLAAAVAVALSRPARLRRSAPARSGAPAPPRA